MIIPFLQILPSNQTAAEQVRAELSRWETNYVDVAALKDRVEQAERDKEALEDKVTLLERRIEVSDTILLSSNPNLILCISKLGAMFSDLSFRHF